MSGYRLTTVETVREEGSWAFTAREGGEDREVFLVPCADEPDGGADAEETDGDGKPVRAWINRCTHEDQRLHREGVGAVTRGGAVVCPKHGSAFDACEGSCDNGEAAGTTLRSIDIDVRDGRCSSPTTTSRTSTRACRTTTPTTTGRRQART